MKKILALVLILSLVFVAGCGKKSAESPVTVAPQAGPTASAVTEVENELNNIDSIDSEMPSSDLDDLDKDLDFTI